MWYLLPPDREFVEMYEAVRHGDMESLKMAINQQIIDVDLRDKYNKTPLMVASAHGRCDVAQLLVDKGYVCRVQYTVPSVELSICVFQELYTYHYVCELNKDPYPILHTYYMCEHVCTG